MKVNFLVDNLGTSQLSYHLIKCGNQLIHDGYGVIAFYERMTRYVLRPSFPSMQIVEAWAQDGVTIATSVGTAIDVIDFPGSSRKLYYVWDMSWMRGPQRTWGSFHSLFTHPELSIIARNDEYAQIIQNAFGKKPEFIVENFHVPTMREILANVSGK
jgi:hypothetical protein